MLLHLDPPEGLGEEADRFLDLPHPREMLSLIGHAEAEAEVLQSWQAGRLHHAWLITGEEGIGKATLAYRIARFLLAYGHLPPETVPAQDLFVPQSHAVSHQVAAAAHPDLAMIHRVPNPSTKNLYTEIRVDDVRKGLDVFNKTASGGGYRIAIVDACDDLNANSANALLKTLEEPPNGGLFLLVSHAPGRLLPTIRSRCRPLALRPLSTAEVAYGLEYLPGARDVELDLRNAAAERSGGSLRRAIGLLDKKKLEFIEKTQGALDALPQMNGAVVDAIAEATTGRTGDDAFENFCDLCERWMETRLRAGDGADLHRLADAWASLTDKRRAVDGLNLDRRPYVVGAFGTLADIVRRRNQAD